MSLFDFNSVADQYDLFYKSEYGQVMDRLEKRAVKKMLKQYGNEPAAMLEIGAGTGHWSRFFANLGFQVTGVDVADEMLERARQKEIPNTTFQQADAHALPFEDDFFDTVSLMATLEFLEDREKVWQEVKRVLKPGGQILTGDLNARSFTGRNREMDPVFGNANFYTADTLKEELSHFGEPIVRGSTYLPFGPNYLQFAAIWEYKVSQSVLDRYGNFLVGLVTNKAQN